MLNFIFDLDDTLIATEELFREAELAFFQEMQKLGFNKEAVANTFVEIDTKNVTYWGFMPKRFYVSMGETYEIMCKLRGVNLPDSATRQRLEEIGQRVFVTRPRVIQGAVEVLEKLARNGDYLLLWTKGDETVQRRKLTWSGLSNYFRQIYIFKQKTKTELLDIVKAHQLPISTTWVVGDSIRSEINPALEIGVNAIWIDSKSGRHEYAEPIQDNYIKLSNLLELLDVYPKLLKGIMR